MTHKQDLHSAYVLHTRAYRETSLLVEIFSQQHGRVTLVARGAKRGKAKASSLLQPFMQLNVGWYGDGELVTLTNVEASGPAHMLSGKSAICGLYINELLVRLMPKWDPCGQLFAHYQLALSSLAGVAVAEQIALRKFEMQLLRSLGYGLQLTKEITTGATIEPELYYMFDPVLGPKLCAQSNIAAISGASLLALASENLDDSRISLGILLDIKRLMRGVFSHHLGARQLVSRELL